LGLRVNPIFNYVSLALLGIGIGLVSLLLGAVMFGTPLFLTYLGYPMLLLLNLLPPVILIFLLYFISGRPWIAFIFPAFFVILASLIHFVKVQIRGDPLLATDILIVREAVVVVQSYTIPLNWKLFFAIGALVCGALFSIFMLKHKIVCKKFRIISSVVTAALCVTLYSAVYTNDRVYEQNSVEMELTQWSMARDFISRGFLFPYISSMQDFGPALFPGRHLPYWYDKDEARQMLQSFGDTAIPPDGKVNIISIMLEAYADLSVFEVLDFTVDVYAPLHRIQAESVSGNLIANVFGGATIDTERLFLTGNTQLTSFVGATNSFVRFLRNQGFYTEGLHVGDMWFYDRRPVNAHLGFENYFFLEDFPEGNRSDEFFFPTVLDLYMNRNRSVPYFSFNVSYQNHGPYPCWETSEPYFINRGELSDSSFNILNNYLTGIYDTNRRLEEFINALRYDPEPVVVVAFGDHMPWLGHAHSVYLELGINIDGSTPEGFLNFHSLPYFIWANYAARELIGHDFVGEGRSFSPAFLMGEAFSLLGWEGEAYMKALRELQETIDVISPLLGVFRENGEITRELSPEGEYQFRRLRAMEIFRRTNFFN